MSLQSKKMSSLFIGILIICQYHLIAQAVFKVSIAPESIGKEETATLRLMIDNARQVEQITPPALGDFDVISGPNQESGMEINNGVTRQYIGITYLIRPKSIGKFSISGSKAIADGKNLTGNSVTLNVTKNGSGKNSNNMPGGFGGLSSLFEPVAQSSFNDYILKKGENPKQKINKNIFLKVITNKTTCFIGEPIVVTYKLYTRLKSESSVTKNPSFNGFSVIDLMAPGNTNYSIEQLNGREYNVYTLRKSQLYPLQAGTVDLESAEVDNTIHFIKEEYFNNQRNEIDEFFGNLIPTAIPPEGMLDEKITLQSRPVTINVKPLPESDKPISFKGAVGKFNLEASVVKNNFTTDDAGKLTITITGEGNMSLITAPEINWPQGIEGYDPKTKDQIEKLTVPISGKKIFEYTFTVPKEGSYRIPSIEFSYFNLAQGKYIKLNTSPLDLTVNKGTGKKVFNNNTSPKATPDGISLGLSATIFLMSISIAILFSILVFMWLRKNKKKVTQKTEPIIPSSIASSLTEANIVLPLQPFALSEEKMIQGDSTEYYNALNNELRKFLANTLQIPLESVSKKTITIEADQQGIAIYTRLQIEQLLDDIEWQLYTPMASGNSIEEMHKRAVDIAAALSKPLS
jgi:hypothetical protein